MVAKVLSKLLSKLLLVPSPARFNGDTYRGVVESSRLRKWWPPKTFSQKAPNVYPYRDASKWYTNTVWGATWANLFEKVSFFDICGRFLRSTIRSSILPPHPSRSSAATFGENGRTRSRRAMQTPKTTSGRPKSRSLTLTNKLVILTSYRRKHSIWYLCAVAVGRTTTHSIPIHTQNILFDVVCNTNNNKWCSRPTLRWWQL